MPEKKMKVKIPRPNVRGHDVTIRREARQETLRDQLRCNEYLASLHKIHERVASKWHRMDSNQIGASRLQADICFRLLAKVLPDLKMVEIQGKIEHLHQEMTRVEIDGVLIAAGIEPDEMFKQLKMVK